MKRLNKLDILIISPEYWGKHFVSKHLYASYLSTDNRVYFLQPGKSWRIKNLFTPIRTELTDISNLNILTDKPIIPKINFWPGWIQRFLFRIMSKRVAKVAGVEFDVVWSFDPHRYWDQSVWGSAKTIYHSVDFHPGALYENIIAKTSDLVLGITQIINKELEIKSGVKVLNIGHGADVEGFKKSENATIELPGNNLFKIGYVGNFHSHLDYQLLISMADKNKDVDFCLIGPTKPNNLSSKNQIDDGKLTELENRKNIFFLGSVTNDRIMSYLKAFSVNLVMFKDENSRIHCNPHKMMAYFYSGRPVLSSYIDEYSESKPQTMIMVSENHEIPGKLEQLKNHQLTFTDSDIHDSIKFAVNHSYSELVKNVLQKLFKESC